MFKKRIKILMIVGMLSSWSGVQHAAAAVDAHVLDCNDDNWRKLSETYDIFDVRREGKELLINLLCTKLQWLHENPWLKTTEIIVGIIKDALPPVLRRSTEIFKRLRVYVEAHLSTLTEGKRSDHEVMSISDFIFATIFKLCEQNYEEDEFSEEDKFWENSPLSEEDTLWEQAKDEHDDNENRHKQEAKVAAMDAAYDAWRDGQFEIGEQVGDGI